MKLCINRTLAILTAFVALFPIMMALPSADAKPMFDSAFFSDMDDGYVGFLNESQIKIQYYHTTGYYMYIQLYEPDGGLAQSWDPVNSTQWYPHIVPGYLYYDLGDEPEIGTWKLKMYSEYEGTQYDYTNVDFIIIDFSSECNDYPNLTNFGNNDSRPLIVSRGDWTPGTDECGLGGAITIYADLRWWKDGDPDQPYIRVRIQTEWKDNNTNIPNGLYGEESCIIHVKKTTYDSGYGYNYGTGGSGGSVDMAGITFQDEEGDAGVNHMHYTGETPGEALNEEIVDVGVSMLSIALGKYGAVIDTVWTIHNILDAMDPPGSDIVNVDCDQLDTVEATASYDSDGKSYGNYSTFNYVKLKYTGDETISYAYEIWAEFHFNTLWEYTLQMDTPHLYFCMIP